MKTGEIYKVQGTEENTEDLIRELRTATKVIPTGGRLLLFDRAIDLAFALKYLKTRGLSFERDPDNSRAVNVTARPVEELKSLAELQGYPPAPPREPRKRLATLHSSDRMDWGTPVDLFKKLNQIFGFTLDAAATEANALVARFIPPEVDALRTSWIEYQNPEGIRPVIWLNPPYGRTLEQWMEKAHRTSQIGATVVILVPSRTDTKWFRWLWEAEALVFLRGRLTFTGATSGAPFPSVLAIMGQGLAWRHRHELNNLGRVVIP